MSLRYYVGRDVLVALNATPVRRVISYTPLTVLTLVGLALSTLVPPWAWIALVLLDFVVFSIVGNRWANEDAISQAASGTTTEA